MKKAGSTKIRFRAYRVDLAFLLVVALTKGLGILIEKITRGALTRKPSPFTIWLTLFLSGDLVALITAALLGTLMTLLEDPVTLAIYILTPIGVAIAFRFYERLFPTFEALVRQGIISGGPKEVTRFINRVDQHLNSRLWAGICFGLGVALILCWLLGFTLIGMEGGFRGWSEDLPLALQVYLSFWGIMTWAALLFFAYKAAVVWWTIQTLPIANRENICEPRLNVDIHYPDRCAGYSRLSNLWLHVNYITVLIGMCLFAYAISNGWNFWSWILAITYLILAPPLFFAPFLRLHSLMLNSKEQELEEHLIAWKKAKEAGKDKEEIDHWRRQYDEAQQLPTWPFNWKTNILFLGTYLFPPLVAVIIEVL
ncbi:MAG: hypothetical protein JXB43_02500 [Dehalococcoidia bacterium]|nr:hypothetical protein [Dehalococcoidia bacterium]